MRKVNTIGRVGDFFNHLVRAITGGVIPEVGSESWLDVVNEDLDLQVEVKASDNNHNFRISTTQIRRHIEAVQFPFDLLYSLCSYRNGSRKAHARGKAGPNFSLLARHTKRLDQFEVLAQKTDEVFIVEVPVITAFQQKLGTRTGQYAGDGRDDEVLEFRRSDLRPLWNGHRREVLKSLELDPRKWMLGSFDMVVPLSIDDHNHRVNFRLYTILHPGLHRRLVKARNFPQNLLV